MKEKGIPLHERFTTDNGRPSTTRMNRIFPLIFIALATALSLLPTGCSSDAARPAASDSTLIVDHISRLSIEEPRRALALIITSDGRKLLR